MGPDQGEVEHDCAYRVQAPAPVNAHEQILREFEDGDTLILVRTLGKWAAFYEPRKPGEQLLPGRADRVIAFGPTPDDALVALAERIASRARTVPS